MRPNCSPAIRTSTPANWSRWPKSRWVIGPSMMYWITFGIDAAAARLPSWASRKITMYRRYGRGYGELGRQREGPQGRAHFSPDTPPDAGATKQPQTVLTPPPE